MNTVRHLIGLALLGCGGVLAAEPSLSPSADGSEIVQAEAHLAWRRCVEGMNWNGRTCVDSPRLLSHAQALAAAAERREATGQAWRVPRVQDLERLVHVRAKMDSDRLFPGAVAGWYWTSTARVDARSVNPYDYGNIRRGVTEQNVNRLGFMHGWAVNSETGAASDEFAKKTQLPVRLVRSLDP